MRNFLQSPRLLAGAATVASLLASWLILSCQPNSAADSRFMPVSHHSARQAAASPERCMQCHPREVEDWRNSHHAHANRPIDPERDAGAFARPVVNESGEGVQPLHDSSGRFLFEEVGSPGALHEIDGVIGYDPLRQYLVRAEGGRWQAHSLSYDPDTGEWFDQFPGEGRQPGDWGHWTGQAMNWNANCAFCHMSEFEKHYDVDSNHYASTWTVQGVSCIQCHSQSGEHATAAENGQYAPAGRSVGSVAAFQENCASCHARREEITAQGFREGVRFHDHFRLALPEVAGAYFPDGQSREENFVYGSFMLSAMGHAGVTCMDCHNPHSGQLRLPAENNALCMQCHQTARMGAPIIDPTRHSHHPAGSSGNRCIECHMPARTYMVRDPRRDHGFTSPDPVLSIELGVPNACNQCHREESMEWAAAHAEQWFSSPDRERRRTRAHILAQVEDLSTVFPAAELLDLAADEENPWWRAAYLRMLASSDPSAESLALAEANLAHEQAVVRAAAVPLVAAGTDSPEAVVEALSDPAREVRTAASESLHRMRLLASADSTEFQDYLEANADRPGSRLRLAERALAEDDAAGARRHLEQATRFDRYNEQLYFEASIILARAGRTGQALEWLNLVPEAARQSGLVEYARALLLAELGSHAAAARSLRIAVGKDPQQARWWYNLALAYLQDQDSSAAEGAIIEGLNHSPSDPDLLDLQRFLKQPAR